ncbi:CPBP family intramembrane glutamic endopeptidase [Anaerosporobacter sp.]
MSKIINSVVAIMRLFLVVLITIFVIRRLTSNVANEQIKEGMRYLAFVISSLFCAKVFDKLSLQDLGLKYSYRIILYFVIGVCMVVALYSISQYSLGNKSTYISIQSLSKEYVMVIYWFLVALGEEVLFRGYLIAKIKKNYSTVTAIIISGIIFSLLHFVNTEISGVFSYALLFSFGFLISWICINIKSIWFGIGVHLAWNYIDTFIENTSLEKAMIFGITIILFVIAILSTNHDKQYHDTSQVS